MKKTLLAATTALAIAFAAPAEAKREVYNIDPEHTSIQFGVSHVGFSNTIGRFEFYTASIELDGEKPENSQVSITIDAKSVRTPSEGLNKHLLNADFFNVEKHPEIKFTSTKVTKVDEKHYKLTGDLTMLGTTKPVTLDVTFNKAGDFYGKQRAGFSIKGVIDRTDFGMGYMPDAIGTKVELMIEVEAAKHDAAPPQGKKS